MTKLGHTDAGFTLRVYAHAVRRDEGDKQRLEALVESRDRARRVSTCDLSRVKRDEGTGGQPPEQDRFL